MKRKAKLQEKRKQELKDQQYKLSNLWYLESGLSEFFIWRDDFNERVKANNSLDNVKNELRKLLNL